MFAIIKTGGKQYIVAPGKKVKIEKLDVEEGGAVSFDEVLAVFDEATAEIGTPLVSGARVSGTVLKQGRAKKITNLRYHSKTRYRRKQGHRQPYTEIEITDIVAK